MHDGLQGVALKGLEVHLTDLNDNLKGHEVDNAMLNCVLVGQKVYIDNLANNGAQHLVEAKKPSDSGTVTFEQVGLLVRELHDVHALGDLWVEHKVKRDSAWEFNVENSEAVAELVIISALLVLCYGAYHAEKHKVYDALDLQS